MIDWFYILGIALCVGVLMQMGLWISLSLAQLNFNRQQFEAARELFQQQLGQAATKRSNHSIASTDTWSGYREFFVDRLEKETANVTSIYFQPVDGKPIADFKSGQYLSFRFQLPGEPKPLIRCYSLSRGPGNGYRISVKAVPPPADRPDLPPGRVSNFIQHALMVGDRVEVKAPAGSFLLDDKGDAPIVLLAGGIGITPMISMLEDLASRNSERLIVLFYGVRCGREHAFKNELMKLAEGRPNLHVVTCYSDPDPDDRLKSDYQVKGYVSVELIKLLLPDNRCRFHLCGPPPFLESLRSGLADWQVPDNRVSHEAFGPATIRKATTAVGHTDSVESGNVRFSATGKTIPWNNDCESLLEFAEANGIAVESGCRAGSCKTCAIGIGRGKVKYPEGITIDCEPGHCLPCIAKPAGDLELDA